MMQTVRQSLDVINTPILSMGKYTTDFEKTFCDLTGAKHAIAVNSGTAGLHLCVRAAGIGAGDLVITTPFSFVASSNALLFENAIPVFVDIDPRTGNINPELVADAAKNYREVFSAKAARKVAGAKVVESDSPSRCFRSARGYGCDQRGRKRTWPDCHRRFMRSAGRDLQRKTSRHAR